TKYPFSKKNKNAFDLAFFDRHKKTFLAYLPSLNGLCLIHNNLLFMYQNYLLNYIGLAVWAVDTICVSAHNKPFVERFMGHRFMGHVFIHLLPQSHPTVFVFKYKHMFCDKLLNRFLIFV
ncbi:hypothetical protein ACJX0J_025835, partial [Zea mays]